MGSHQNVPQINIWAGNTVKNACEVRQIGGQNRGADGSKLGNQEMILLVASANDVSVDLVEVPDSFASSQER